MNSMHIQSVFAAIFGISTRITVEEDDGDILVSFDLADGTPMHYMHTPGDADVAYDFTPGDVAAPYEFASICFPVLQ